VLVSALTPSHAVPASSGPDDLHSFRLTEREAEVVMLAARGFSVLNVASQLSIAESTVRTHVKNAYRKMRVSNRAELTSRVLGAVVGLAAPVGTPEAAHVAAPPERSPSGR
jgi:DNA-binding NarL/FixJ family response regulator